MILDDKESLSIDDYLVGGTAASLAFTLVFWGLAAIFLSTRFLFLGIDTAVAALVCVLILFYLHRIQ